MKTLIPHVSITRSYTAVTDVCQAVGRCARVGMSPNYYIYSTVFMKFLTLFRKKTRFCRYFTLVMWKAAQRDGSWRVCCEISLVIVKKIMRVPISLNLILFFLTVVQTEWLTVTETEIWFVGSNSRIVCVSRFHSTFRNWFNARKWRKNISLAISAILRAGCTFQNHQINFILYYFI